MESGNLVDVLTTEPPKLVRVLFDAHAPALAYIKPSPDAELVQAI